MPTHYEVLGLSINAGSAENPFTKELKSAYRKALLLHHPDKAQSGAATSGKQSASCRPVYSVDQISTAYNVLSLPKLRAKYDTSLLLQIHEHSGSAGHRNREEFLTGVEVMDLDDLDYDDHKGLWYKGCRCGDGRGFIITEADLEAVIDEGELGVECIGCSLWIKVLFSASEESYDGEVSVMSISG